MTLRLLLVFTLANTIALAADGEPERTPATALAGIDVVPEVDATLIGAEPLLLSPASIDVDHKGRVWVCEVVNYRRFANQNRQDREEGDRILILEDSNGDGVLDHSTTFYQGRDIDGIQGICVLGNRVIAATPEKIYNLYDDNGDSKADRIELLFTADHPIDHDHGMHAFMFGPDGRLYFNYGNEPKQLLRADGTVVVDKTGNEVTADRKPYQQGMAFRCELDGSNVETLGWNFRNNWELTVDSFGTIWQSDNDDDGNRGTRINYVMEFGNYGYRDEITGATWNTPRTGLEKEVHDRHWHQNDPGVIPNILVTGQGAPCGIEVYEADLLPERFRNQLVHCDAGVSVVRSYATEEAGAGYRASINPLMTGSRDLWFRPCDLALAADGSLIVGDWYDPGVGGHRQGDVDRGRLFRIAPKGHRWNHPKFDFTTIEGAVQALISPNREARYLAWQTLAGEGAKAESALNDVWSNHANPRMRARVLWLLARLDGRTEHYIDQAAEEDDHNLRITALRLARQLDTELASTIDGLTNDKSVAVRRECLVALHDLPQDQRAARWMKLAAQLPDGDRWYLEALGIAARDNWDACLALLDRSNVSAAVRDALIWRSRAADSARRIVAIIHDAVSSGGNVNADEVAHWFRALDFQNARQVDKAIQGLIDPAFQAQLGEELRKQIATESLTRIRTTNLARDSKTAQALNAALDHVDGSDFVRLVERFRLDDRYPDLVKLILADPDGNTAISAAQCLVNVGQTDLLTDRLRSRQAETAIAAATAMGNTHNSAFQPALLSVIDDEDADLSFRRAAVRSGARIGSLAVQLMDRVEKGTLDESLKTSLAAALHASSNQFFRDAGRRLFPLPEGKEGEKLPPLEELMKREGDVRNGRLVFNTTGTCQKCHIVNGIGRAIGPDLSEIGRKLSRQALFESVLFPSAGISHNYDSWTLVLLNGTTVTGLVADETADSITILDNEARKLTFASDDIDEKIRSTVSMMPADLQKIMTAQELIDVVLYLETLKEKIGQ